MQKYSTVPGLVVLGILPPACGSRGSHSWWGYTPRASFPIFQVFDFRAFQLGNLHSSLELSGWAFAFLFIWSYFLLSLLFSLTCNNKPQEKKKDGNGEVLYRWQMLYCLFNLLLENQPFVLLSLLAPLHISSYNNLMKNMLKHWCEIMFCFFSRKTTWDWSPDN